jgi:hypothetical protein
MMGTKKTILRPDITSAANPNFGEVVATREIEITTLNIDPSYQRSDFLNMTVVNKIGSEFSLVRFNVLIVAQRLDGSLWVVDGQHRYFGAKKAGQTTVPCRVFSSQGPQQEASVFYDLNKTRTSINAISMYRALLRQDEVTSVAIQALLDKYNFAIGKGGRRAFQAASAIREVYKRGVLDEVLKVIDQSFGDGSTQRWRMMFAQSHFIQMLGLIYQQKKDEIDSERMTLVLARMDEKAYGRMSSSSAGTTGGRAKRIAPVFIEEFYNKQLSVKNKVVW